VAVSAAGENDIYLIVPVYVPAGDALDDEFQDAAVLGAQAIGSDGIFGPVSAIT
jgi:hypothetical protein